MESKRMTGLSIVSTIALTAVCVSLVTCAPTSWPDQENSNLTLYEDAGHLEKEPDKKVSSPEAKSENGLSRVGESNPKNASNGSLPEDTWSDDSNQSRHDHLPHFKNIDPKVTANSTDSGSEKKQVPTKSDSDYFHLDSETIGPSDDFIVSENADNYEPLPPQNITSNEGAQGSRGPKDLDPRPAVHVDPESSGDVHGDADSKGSEPSPPLQYQSEIVEEDYGVRNIGAHALDIPDSLHDHLSVTSAGSPDADAMTLSDDVIIDALFTNLDILQDNVEMCEEGLRQKLAQKTTKDMYTSEEASNIIDVDGNHSDVTDDGDDGDDANDDDDDDETDQADSDELTSQNEHDSSESELKTSHEEIQSHTMSNPERDLEQQAQDMADTDVLDAEENGDVQDFSSHIPGKPVVITDEPAASQDSSVQDDKSTVKGDEEDVQDGESVFKTPVKPAATLRKRRSAGDNPGNSNPRVSQEKGIKLSNVPTAIRKISHHQASHDVVMRLSNRLQYLKTSLEECYLLYKQLDHVEDEDNF